MENKTLRRSTRLALAVPALFMLCAAVVRAGDPAREADGSVYGSVDRRLKTLSAEDRSFKGLEGFSSSSREIPALGASKVAAEPERRVPQGARSFLPERKFVPQTISRRATEKAATVRLAAAAAVAADTATLRRDAEALATQFGKQYSDIAIAVNWDSSDINAYAWVEDGKKHISIEGGLVRHASMGKEGMALVLSHEVGHHEGGAPRYPNLTLSCEGQADYWGAANAMKNVFSSDYKEQMEPAIRQLGAVLGQLYEGVSEEDQEREFQSSNKCGYPTISCRKKTYEAAMAGKPKPECAGGEAQPKIAMLIR